MTSLAIIPARGGSKRIPRKNIKPFLGVPVITYPIKAAINSGCFDEVMVSTDDAEIAEAAKSFGAKVPFFRSNETASDMATTAAALLEVLDEYKKIGKQYDQVCCIYPTAVFVTAAKLKDAKQRLESSGAEAVVPVIRFGYPIQRALKIVDNKLQMFWPEHLNTRSQDLEPSYQDGGQFYFLTVAALLEQKTLFPKVTAPIELNEMEAQDIDTKQDWQLAEIKYKWMLDKRNA